MTSSAAHLRRARFWILLFIVGLALSGVTAFPLVAETSWLLRLLQGPLHPAAEALHLLPWVARVHGALTATDDAYPFLAYGTDWLAFGHLVIALAFWGVWLDPVRNKWLLTFGLIACAGVVPLAFVAGAVRGIPFGWRLVDCSFGLFGAVPLLLCRRAVHALELDSRSAL